MHTDKHRLETMGKIEIINDVIMLDLENLFSGKAKWIKEVFQECKVNDPKLMIVLDSQKDVMQNDSYGFDLQYDLESEAKRFIDSHLC